MMKNWKKLAQICTAFVFACMLSLSLAACSGTTSSQNNNDATKPADTNNPLGLVEPGKLKVIGNLVFYPFEYLDDQGKAQGYDMDLMAAIAQHLGLELEVEPSLDFDALIPAIQSGGRADVAISGITITDQRLDKVAMSDPYFDSNQGVVVLNNSPLTLDDLNNPERTVAVQRGTSGEEWTKENLPKAKLMPLDDVTLAMAGAQTKLYDAVVADLPVVQNMIMQSYSDLKVLAEIPTGEQYGIVSKKDNKALADAINKHLVVHQCPFLHVVYRSCYVLHDHIKGL